MKTVTLDASIPAWRCMIAKFDPARRRRNLRNVSQFKLSKRVVSTVFYHRLLSSQPPSYHLESVYRIQDGCFDVSTRSASGESDDMAVIGADEQGLFLGGSRTSGAEVRDANGEL
jgi:hypothetical protein